MGVDGANPFGLRLSMAYQVIGQAQRERPVVLAGRRGTPPQKRRQKRYPALDGSALIAIKSVVFGWCALRRCRQLHHHRPMIRTQVRPEVRAHLPPARSSQHRVQRQHRQPSPRAGPVGHHALGAAQGASKATKTKIDAVWGVPTASMCVLGARAAITRPHHMRN